MKDIDSEFSTFQEQGGFPVWTKEHHPDASRKTGYAPSLNCSELETVLDPITSMPIGLLQVYLSNRLLATREEEALITDNLHPASPEPLKQPFRHSPRGCCSQSFPSVVGSCSVPS